jgi:hypothetical protein
MSCGTCSPAGNRGSAEGFGAPFVGGGQQPFVCCPVDGGNTPSWPASHSVGHGVLGSSAWHQCGPCTAWAVSHAENGAALPLLAVERIASRAAIVAMWDVLADFAATAVIPSATRGYRLTQQPFLAWHAVVTRGNGLRVIRR